MNNGKICIPVNAGTAAGMIEQIRRAEALADVIEIRFDYLPDTEIRKLVDQLPEISKRYLFTFRPREQGGNREIEPRARLKFWELIFNRVSADFLVDIERESALLLAVSPQHRIRIVSMHDFSARHGDVDGHFTVMSDLVDGPIKIAAMANDITDAIAVWKLINVAKRIKRDVIPVAMGEAGKWTRILGPAYGAYLTYASLDEGRGTADGQITAADMHDVYRVKEITPVTRVFGVIGDPVSSSLSPYMHNAAFKAAGIDAVFMHLQVKDLDAFMGRMVKPATREVELNFAGFSITMPHKQAVLAYLDDIDETARKIGAVNTVKIEGGRMTGYNTDAHGFITPLKEQFGDLKDARVVLLGAGGAARACVYSLKAAGAYVTAFVRDVAKAAAFGHEFGVPVKRISDPEFEISNHARGPEQLMSNLRSDISNRDLMAGKYDIVVNATPTGMKGPLGNETLLTADELSGVKFVYDLVTRKGETPLLREARLAGVPVIGGLEMLIAQGARQFEIWTGEKAPVDIMRSTVDQRMKS